METHALVNCICKCKVHGNLTLHLTHGWFCIQTHFWFGMYYKWRKSRSSQSQKANVLQWKDARLPLQSLTTRVYWPCVTHSSLPSSPPVSEDCVVPEVSEVSQQVSPHMDPRETADQVRHKPYWSWTIALHLQVHRCMYMYMGMNINFNYISLITSQQQDRFSFIPRLSPQAHIVIVWPLTPSKTVWF